MTEITARDIHSFIEDYATMMNAGVAGEAPEATRLAALFAQDFIAASPAGMMAGRNEGLGEIIAQGIEGYRKMGGTAFVAEHVAVDELAPASFMATVDWQFDYRRPGDGRTGSIAFTNRYFVSTADGTPKIFAWITPDEQAALAEHGLG